MPTAQLVLVDGAVGRQPGRRSAPDLDRWSERQRTPAAALPEPRQWAARLVQGVLEVLAGHRPVQQLARWTDEQVYAELSARAGAARRAVPAGQVAPRLGARAYVRSVHTCEPVDGVVEAAALVQLHGRCRAMALRLEGLDGRWRATVTRLV